LPCDTIAMLIVHRLRSSATVAHYDSRVGVTWITSPPPAESSSSAEPERLRRSPNLEISEPGARSRPGGFDALRVYRRSGSPCCLLGDSLPPGPARAPVAPLRDALTERLGVGRLRTA
jgi:hypothetical protein